MRRTFRQNLGVDRGQASRLITLLEGSDRIVVGDRVHVGRVGQDLYRDEVYFLKDNNDGAALQ
jgi:hypothetical protein